MMDDARRICEDYWAQLEKAREKVYNSMVQESLAKGTLGKAQKFLKDMIAETDDGTLIRTVIEDALSNINMQIKLETDAILNRPLFDNNIHSTEDREDEYLRMKRLILGAILNAGGRLLIEPDAQQIVGKMTSNELNRIDIEFIQCNHSMDGHIQANKTRPEPSAFDPQMFAPPYDDANPIYQKQEESQ